MLVFLAPFAFFGLALLAVPILAHLFKPRRVRVIPFSSLRWLRTSRHQLSRRIQLHQVLLFLLRAGFLTLLILALAKPAITLTKTDRAHNTAIIIDTGRTMAYAPPERISPMELARAAATSLLREIPSSDRAAVITADAGATAIIPPAIDPAASCSRLQTIKANLANTDLASALRLIPPLWPAEAERKNFELVIITDLLAASWSQGAISKFLNDFGHPLHTRIIDVGIERPQNAWIAEARLDPPGANGNRTISATLGAVGDQAHERVLRLSGLPGLADQTRKITLESGRPALVSFSLPAGFDLTGRVAQLSLEPRDALAGDDIYWLPTEQKGILRILLIEPPSTQIAELKPAFHLHVGLEALAAGAEYETDIIARTPATLRPADMAAADAIILADIPELTEEQTATLHSRIREGAGLAVFLGPDLDTNFFNTRLHNPFAPKSSLIPVEIMEQENAGAEFARLGEIQWNHPLLEALADPAYGDLSGVAIRSFRKLRIQERQDDVAVLARVNDGTPAILASSFGAGKVLVFNTTANDAWSDLPRRKNFVPLLDATIAHLAGGWRRRVFTPGDTVVLPLPADAEDVIITTPSGRELQPSLSRVAGKLTAQLDNVSELGIFILRYNTPAEQQQIPFVAQSSRRGSTMARISEGALKAWWAPVETEIIAADPHSDAALKLPKRHSFEPLLLFLAFAALFCEMIMVHRVCPKAPPPIARDPSILADGFFKPKQPFKQDADA